MTPNDVKELLKTLIAEEGLSIDVIEITPSQDLTSDYTTESRIKDVIHQWNKDGKIYTRPPGRAEIMEFYTKTDSVSPAKELLESLEVETFIESIITEQNLPIRFTDHGFRLVALAEHDTTRYPVKILHGGFRLEKSLGTEVKSKDLEGVADRFEAILKEKRTKAKLFHRGFMFERHPDVDVPTTRIKEIAKQIDETLGINYVFDSCSYPRSKKGTSETTWTSANIRISLWRFPRR